MPPGMMPPGMMMPGMMPGMRTRGAGKCERLLADKAASGFKWLVYSHNPVRISSLVVSRFNWVVYLHNPVRIS
jgi:hypothetical protein